MAKTVLMSEVFGGRVQGRPRVGWMDGVEVTMGSRHIAVEGTRQCSKDKRENAALVHM